MKYITGQDLVSDIKLELRSFDESGKITDAIIYAELSGLLNMMGIRILPIHSTVVYIQDFKAPLPKDFTSLLSAYSCETIETIYQSPSIVTYEKEVEEIPICKTRCDYCWNGNGDLFEVILKKERQTWKVKDTKVLSVANDSTDCNECINPRTPNNYDITVKNNEFHSRYRNLKVFIEYRGSIESGGDLLIPDFPEITRYLKAYLKAYILKDIFINYDMDQSIISRIQLLEQSLPALEAQATQLSRFNEIGTFYELRSMLRKNYKYNSSSLYNRRNDYFPYRF